MNAARDRRGVRRILRLALAEWRGWLVVAIATILLSLTSLLHPWPLALLLDQVLVDPTRASQASGVVVALLSLAGVALYAIDATLDYVITRRWISVGQKLVYDLSVRMFAHAQRLGVVRHSRSSVGDQLSRITGDSWCVYNLAASLLFTPANALLMIAVTLALMWPISPSMAMASLAIAPVQAAIGLFVGRALRDAHRGERDAEGRIDAHVQQTLAGIPVVQSFAQEQRELLRFAELTGSALRAQRRAALLGGLGHFFSGAVAAIGGAVILVLAGRETLAGRMTLGQMQLVVAYQAMLHGEFAQLLGVWQSVQGARASVDRALELLDEPIEVSSPASAKPLPAPSEQPLIEMRRVTFRYDVTPVLRDVSLVIAEGESVALIGPSGSGKSTLAGMLLPRLADPQAGSILLRGVDMRELSLADVRRTVAVASQEPALLPVSVADNLRIANEHASDDELWAALHAACADDFVAELDSGLDTELGESGATLSGGQRQRLGIARALLRDADLLVLDEPTSALDADLEQQLIDRVLARRAGRSTIVIAHRMSVARRCDRIVAMESGRVVSASLIAVEGIA
jgi:ATP-binding cassette subfamily B protein/subfamily B ATP-binding cassette protein MsbA